MNIMMEIGVTVMIWFWVLAVCGVCVYTVYKWWKDR